MRKSLNLVIMLMAAGTLIFAGGSQPGSSTAGIPVVRWSFWGGELRIQNTQRTIDVFTEENGIIVSAEPSPGATDHFNKFRTQFASGNAADIIQLGGDFSNLNVGDNVGSVLLPLDRYVRSGVLDISSVDPAAIAAGTVNGTLYALPIAANMPGFLYNKSLLERAGAPLPASSMTWPEFEAWLYAVKAVLPPGVYVLADNSATVSASYFFTYWCRQNGTSIWDGKASYISAADVQRYFDLWAGYRNAGLVLPADIAADYTEANEANSSLIAGKVAVCAIWSNMLVNFQSAIKDTLDLFEFPNAVSTNALWGQMSQMMSISRNSRSSEAAARFINYRVNDPGVWKIMGADPGTPVTPDAREVVSNTDEARRIASYHNVASQHASVRDPNMPRETEWNSSFHSIAQNVAFGRITSAQGAEQVIELVNRFTR